MATVAADGNGRPASIAQADCRRYNKVPAAPHISAVFLLLLSAMMPLQNEFLDLDQDVHVRMLSGRSVSLQVQGRIHHIRVGDTSPEGVLVLRANSSEATLQYQGQQRTMGLSSVPVASQQANLPRDAASVAIPRHPDSHYYANGQINQRPVRMMVDTGASMVSMSSGHARALGLDLRGARLTQVATASGSTDAYKARLDSVKVGEISRKNVDALVIVGDNPRVILLGNSFLSTLRMREEDDVLTLTNPY